MGKTSRHQKLICEQICHTSAVA